MSEVIESRPGSPLAYLAVLLLLAGSCGPVGVRKVMPGQTDASDEEGGSGGSSDSGGSGGSDRPDARASGGRGGSGGTGGAGGRGGTGGSSFDAAAGAGGGEDAGQPDLAGSMDTGSSGPDGPQTCVMTMPGVFVNTNMANQTGTFTVRFSATPSAAPTDAIVAMSNGPQTGYAGFATSVRFNAMGMIDAVNGGAYAAAGSVPYSAGTTYHFRIAVNVTAHTYSVHVTPAGGAEATIGNGYGFRTGQTTITSLNSWGAVMRAGAAGTVNVCGFSIE